MIKQERQEILSRKRSTCGQVNGEQAENKQQTVEVKIFYGNARGINNKIIQVEIRPLAIELEVDVISFAETKLSSDH